MLSFDTEEDLKFSLIVSENFAFVVGSDCFFNGRKFCVWFYYCEHVETIST